MLVVAILLLCALFAPLLAPHDPTYRSRIDRGIAPLEISQYLLGTDYVGRDVLSRLIYGARTSALVTLSMLGASAVIGTTLGLIAGFLGGSIERQVQGNAGYFLGSTTRLGHVVLAFFVIGIFVPYLIFFLGFGIKSIMIIGAVSLWGKFALMVRDAVIRTRQQESDASADISGPSDPNVTLRRLLHNTAHSLLAATLLQARFALLLEAFLALFGLELASEFPAWGAMVFRGGAVELDLWWPFLFPTLTGIVVFFAYHFLGEWAHGTLDREPHRR